MSSEDVLEVRVSRHVFVTERPFSNVINGVYEGISQPDIETLFGELAASTTYGQLSSLVRQAQGSAGLMRFLQLDLSAVLSLDPEASGQASRRLVRLIAGNPVTMGQMTRHLPDAGSYAPVTILIDERPDEVHISYDRMASFLASYGNPAALTVAQELDEKVEALITAAAG